MASAAPASGAAAAARARPKTVLKDILRLKVISMGDGGVGKTCIIKRYCEEKFQPKYISTIGVDFGVKPETVGGRECKINFWDLSGHPEFFEVRNEFYKDTQGALLVFDCTSRRSFDALDAWHREATGFGAQNVSFALCGNKTDLVGERQVTEAEASQWARQRNMRYFDLSAKSGQGITEMFQFLFKAVVENVPKL